MQQQRRHPWSIPGAGQWFPRVAWGSVQSKRSYGNKSLFRGFLPSLCVRITGANPHELILSAKGLSVLGPQVEATRANTQGREAVED